MVVVCGRINKERVGGDVRGPGGDALVVFVMVPDVVVR